MSALQQQLQTADAQADVALAFDPETSPISGQQAWAILDLHGNMVRSSSAGGGEVPPIVRDAPTLYNMLVESTPLVTSNSDTTTTNGLKRMTINFSSVRYILARDENHIYLVQTKST